MKVLTYNVHGWHTPAGEPNVGAVARVIRDSGADLVGLNEVFHPDNAAGPASLDSLARELSMQLAFGATQPSDSAPRHPPYGNGFLSRWPILAHAAHHLAPLTDYGKRGLLEVRVLLPSGRPFTVYVTHLDHRSEAIRIQQWAAAYTWLVRDRGRPHLVLGDFNALAESDYEAYGSHERLAAFQAAQGWPVASFELVGRVVKAGYIDAQAHAAAAAAAPSGATYPAANPERRIDYIFVPSTWSAALRCCSPVHSADTAAASDHLPVLADLDSPA